VAGNKSSSLVLVYLAPNHLLCAVPNNVRGRRDSPGRKLVDLTDKSLFLRVSKGFMVQGGCYGSGEGLALVPSH
jgi:hypothetical protein